MSPVVVVPTPEDREGYSRLIQQYADGACVIAVSAPVYPTLDDAVIYFRVRDSGHGFLRVVRKAGVWEIRERATMIE
jgi:hypothetical protein